MKELFNLILKFKIKDLFFNSTQNEFIKFFRYCFVGGIAFIVDYAAFVVSSIILGDSKISVILSTAIGFVFGLLINFILSKLFVFTEKANTDNYIKEFGAYGVIGIIGLGINEILMLIFITFINKYYAKIIVALIVLIYNYFARKIFLYSGGEK